MVTSIFIAVLIAAFLVELWLDRRQLQTVKAHRNEVPETFRDHISLEAHQKAADYTLTDRKSVV